MTLQAVVTLTFFSLRESSKWLDDDSTSNSIPYSDTTWSSNQFLRTRSAPEGRGQLENSPLLTPCSCASKTGMFCLVTNSMTFRKLI